ncbi:hemerythrin domain-containing protein [Desertibaculum subflavum]|uniref:hemerythrin domain-containing protein n=1 Tax=Desertibaculum subflavum TaxID=2268458 RepID=UPI000E66A6AE
MARATKKSAKGGAKARDAIALLKADHREVMDLFDKFEKAKGGDRKAALAEKICQELMIHTMIEEEIFYPSLRGQAEDDMLDEAHVEHDGAKVLISEILAGGPDDPFYEAKVTVLREEIKHHVKEEEQRGGLFAQAKSADIDLKQLGEQMMRRKQELKSQFESGEMSPPETRTFHGGELSRGKPFDSPQLAA